MPGSLVAQDLEGRFSSPVSVLGYKHSSLQAVNPNMNPLCFSPGGVYFPPHSCHPSCGIGCHPTELPWPSPHCLIRGALVMWGLFYCR